MKVELCAKVTKGRVVSEDATRLRASGSMMSEPLAENVEDASHPEMEILTADKIFLLMKKEYRLEYRDFFSSAIRKI